MNARHVRQTAVPGWSDDGQARLASSYGIVIGAGLVGGAAAAQLVAAGVGHVAVVDGGAVGEEDLGGQSLHFTPDVGTGKADSAAQKLGVLNPEVQVEAFPAYLDADNADAILAGADCAIDASNNVLTTDAINAACVRGGLALVIAAAHRAVAELLVVKPGATACYRCVHPELPAACDHAVLGPVAGVAGQLAALAALKLLAGVGDATPGRVLAFDGTTTTWSASDVARRAACSCCGGDGTTTV